MLQLVRFALSNSNTTQAALKVPLQLCDQLPALSGTCRTLVTANPILALSAANLYGKSSIKFYQDLLTGQVDPSTIPSLVRFCEVRCVSICARFVLRSKQTSSMGSVLFEALKTTNVCLRANASKLSLLVIFMCSCLSRSFFFICRFRLVCFFSLAQLGANNLTPDSLRLVFCNTSQFGQVFTFPADQASHKVSPVLSASAFLHCCVIMLAFWDI